MIGTNNHMSSPPEVTARDIRLIVKQLRTKLPQTKVLVLAIFPRGGGDDDGARQINMRVNDLIANIGDDKMVHYLNINEAFLNGRRLRQSLIPDGTHPNEKGYAAWAEDMEPTLAKLLGEEPVIPAAQRVPIEQGLNLFLIHISRCRRSTHCTSRCSPYH